MKPNEIADCRVSLLDFTKRMFRARKGVDFVENWHHAKICDALEQVVIGKTRRLIINIPPRYSKAIDCATPMWTPDGWKRADEVRVGDRLLGSNGQWTSVIGVHPQGVKPAYDVRFSDGSSLVACGDHRWSARLRDKIDSRGWSAPWQVKTTDELRGDLREADGRKKWRIPVLNDTNTVDIDLPIDPYLLGCWLGDGHTHVAAITTMDAEIVDAFAEYDPTPHTHQNAGKAITYGLRNGFVSKLRELGVLGSKHIPALYMHGSHAQRLALLQGIADTDGWVGEANGQQGIASSIPRLSSDIRSLVNSLGGVWRGCTSIPKNGKPSHKTHLTMAEGDIAFRLPRKVQRVRQRAECNMPRRFVDEIVPVSARDMVCFTVDAEDSLFCAGRDFVVTHNTEIAVVNFMAWCIGNFPDSEFIHASYSARLAANNSYQTRALVDSDAFREVFPWSELMGDSKAKDEWRTKHGGIVYATGAEGSITGYGAGKLRDYFGGALVIDDPHKAGEASSDTMRQNVLDWFSTTVESRCNSPDTPIIVIMQRLHENDLAGWLLGGGNGEKWEHLCIPARDIKDKPLWPFKHDDEALLRMESANPYVFAGQYMQRPAPLGGGIFKDSWWRYYSVMPRIKWRAIYADTAQKTKEQNDYSVFQCWGKSHDGQAILIDQIRGKWEAPELLVQARAFYAKHKQGQGILRAFKIEDKASGTGLIQQLKREGVPVTPIPRTTDKVSRAFDCAPMIESGNVLLPEGAHWLSEYLSEFAQFPRGNHDDQIDPTMDAIADILTDHNYDLSALTAL